MVLDRLRLSDLIVVRDVSQCRRGNKEYRMQSEKEDQGGREEEVNDCLAERVTGEEREDKSMVR